MINEGRFIEEENCKMKDVSDKNYTKEGGIMADNHELITDINEESFDKDALIKATIHTMGYARSGKALVEAVECGIKYGFKTGELIRNEDKTIGRVQKY